MIGVYLSLKTPLADGVLAVAQELHPRNYISPSKENVSLIYRLRDGG
jgi:hypothetical protein